MRIVKALSEPLFLTRSRQSDLSFEIHIILRNFSLTRIAIHPTTQRSNFPFY